MSFSSREAPDARSPGVVRVDFRVLRAAVVRQPLRVALHRQGSGRFRLRWRRLSRTDPPSAGISDEAAQHHHLDG